MNNNEKGMDFGKPKLTRCHENLEDQCHDSLALGAGQKNHSAIHSGPTGSL